MTASLLRVAIVEDDRRVQDQPRTTLRSHAWFFRCRELRVPLPVISIMEQRRDDDGRPPWDIVVMDLEMPQMSGIEATRRLKMISPDLKVVVLTVFEDPAAIVEAVSVGADGYLLKKTRARELVEGIRSVAEGGSPLTPDVARTILDLLRALKPAARTGPPPSRFELTDREQQVLRALVNGMS